MATEPTTDNRARARAFFERLADEESATVLVEALVAMLNDAERRGAVPPTLSTDVYALSLVQGTVREKLKSITGKNGILAFPKVALEDTAANIATAVLSALDEYEAPDDEQTDPIQPAA